MEYVIAGADINLFHLLYYILYSKNLKYIWLNNGYYWLKG